MMKELIILVGIQGSGKSTHARELESKGYVVLSSDRVRKENPDFDNNKVFSSMYSQMNKELDLNNDVVIDATNITMKSRRAIFNSLTRANKVNTLIKAVIFATPIKVCEERVLKRNKEKEEHHVPIDVLYKYVRMFQIPLMSEGFDFVYAISHDDEQPDCEGDNPFNRVLNEMKGFNQHNPHHKYTLDVHCKKVSDLAYKDGDAVLGAVGLLHDYGKLFTQTFDDKGIAHYYGHAEYGTYVLLTELPELRIPEEGFVLEIVNYHMLPYNWKTEKSKQRWKERLGERLFDRLAKFNEYDRKGH